MNRWKQVVALLVIIMLSSVTNVMLSQETGDKPTRQSSLEAFSKGDYEKAYNEFSELLQTYPKDPLYKYYSGVCLVKMNRDPEKAESLLRDALNGSSVLRSLPAEAFLYLGKARHMQGKFVDAVDAYNRFTREAGKKRAKEEDVPALIQQCRNEVALPVTREIAGDVTVKKKPEPAEKQAETPITPKKEEPAAEKSLPGVQKLPSGYEKILDDAVVLQSRADSLNELAAKQRKEADGLSGNEKNRLMAAAAANETQALELQKSADEKYNLAQSSMDIRQDSSVARAENRDVKPVKKELKDTLSSVTSKKDQVITQDKPSNKPVDRPAVKLETKNVAVGQVATPVETYSDFEVAEEPVADKDEQIKINPDVPDGLIYRIQVAVFRNPVTLSHFKGIKPVYGFRASNGLTTYFAGMFRRSSDAYEALSVVKSKGFRDAFVVAFSGSKRIAGEKASAMEKEWGNKPFVSLVQKEKPSMADTLPPTLSYRVEVARTDKPLKNEEAEALIRISASRGLDVIKLSDGTMVYLIGNFITFESASEYSDLLKRNGYQDAKVTAWLGKKEIALDTARQLFESLK